MSIEKSFTAYKFVLLDRAPVMFSLPELQRRLCIIILPRIFDLRKSGACPGSAGHAMLPSEASVLYRSGSVCAVRCKSVGRGSRDTAKHDFSLLLW